MGIHMPPRTGMVSPTRCLILILPSAMPLLCLSLVLTNRLSEQAASPHWMKTESPTTGLQTYRRKGIQQINGAQSEALRLFWRLHC